MIKFGPAGNSDLFYEQGNKHTYQAPKWLSEMGLNAFEYSFGRGVRLSEKSGNVIKGEGEKYGVTISVHAPYFINLAGEGEEKFNKNISYFAESSKAAKYLGAKRVIFHPGSCAKIERSVAFAAVMENFKKILAEMDNMGYCNMTYCPETMGKLNQISDLQETARLCLIDERVYPTIDFGHLHARGIGSINTKEDFESIIDYLKNTIGEERTNNMHVHFSKIEYTSKGEKMHRTFADEGFGPNPLYLCEIFAERKMTPTVICESKGTQAVDAQFMARAYNDFLSKL